MGNLPLRQAILWLSVLTYFALDSPNFTKPREAQIHSLNCYRQYTYVDQTEEASSNRTHVTYVYHRLQHHDQIRYAKCQLCIFLEAIISLLWGNENHSVTPHGSIQVYLFQNKILIKCILTVYKLTLPALVLQNKAVFGNMHELASIL